MGADYHSGRPNIEVIDIGSLLATEFYIIPIGRILIAFRSGDADGPQLRITMQDGGGWRNNTQTSENTVVAGIAPDWKFMPLRARSDGAAIRIYNNGPNAVDNIQVMLE